MTEVNAKEFEQRLGDVLAEYDVAYVPARPTRDESVSRGTVALPTNEGQKVLPVHIKQGARAEVLPAEAQQLHDRFPEGVVVAQTYINPGMASRYRRLGLFYADLAGNAWIRQPGLYLFVEGRRRPASAPDSVAGPRPMTTSWLRLGYVLMARPSLSDVPIRQLADAAGLSVGATHRALDELTAQGHIVQGRGGRSLRRMQELAERWVIGYSARLLPTLETRYWRGPEPNSWVLEGLARGATIAGEAIEPAIQHPACTTLFDDPPYVALVRRGRLRPVVDPSTETANVVTRKRFWNEGALQLGGVASPMLTSAELLASPDERLREVGSARLADFVRGLP